MIKARERFLDLLYAKNQQINLVSRKMSRAELDYHWDDALMGQELILTGKKCLDMGSGGGFPALPLAITCPQTSFVLVEAEQKKVNWLEEVRQEMALANVEIIRGRAETLAHDPHLREKFDIVTARAVAEMRVLLEYTLPFVRVGGIFLAWKGPAASEEINSAAHALQELKSTFKQRIDYSINEEARCLLVVEKLDKIPRKYPRDDGIPKKKPL